MARTLSEIYNEIRQKRNEYMALTSYENTSKMSIMNSIMYIMAAGIWSVENMCDVFQVDMAKSINSRINGTMAYYTNALKAYQKGDTLEVSEDGCSFKYPTINESKRTITSAVCYLSNQSGFYDRKLTFKIATGENGAFSRISAEDLVDIKSYMRQIMFAGTNITIESCKGDVLVPKIVVCYDGSIPIADLKESVINSMKEYLSSTAFTGKFYPSKLISCICNVDHVCDVISEGKYDEKDLGIYVAQYDINDHLINTSGQSALVRYINGIELSSGYVREKDSTDTLETFESWADAIIAITEDDLADYTTDSRMVTLNGVVVTNLPVLVINGSERSPYRVI